MNQIESTASKKLALGTARTFNINIMTRILEALREKGQINKTNLAGSCGLNYHQCVKYVNLLLLLDWTRVELDERNQVIVITEKGIEMIERFVNLK